MENWGADKDGYLSDQFGVLYGKSSEEGLAPFFIICR